MIALRWRVVLAVAVGCLGIVLAQLFLHGYGVTPDTTQPGGRYVCDAETGKCRTL